MDFTDLETFGETTTVKTPKVRKTSEEEDACAKSKDATHTPTLNKSEPSVPKTELVQPEIDQDLSGDSEDEKLVIDVSVSPVETPSKQPDATLSSASPTDPVNSESSPPHKAPRRTRQSRRTKTGDQLGEILRMQKAMFSSASDRGKGSTASQETNSPTRTPGPSVSVHSHPTSLVKPCVSSYLERNQDQDGESCTAPQISAPVVNSTSTEHKSWCQMDFHGVHFSCVCMSIITHCALLSLMQKYFHKTCRLVQKMNKITRLQKKETYSISSTVCKTCWSWCEAPSH